ncbi:Protein-export membrane protein SecG [Aquimixticola soesokkakensis]|uniref:Protein-export membrane protein SecG n=1 Tax=Aquimixticola soesokkakensis TaxID=1519096 RepID=A0A1Y5S7I6_9RHOB|nr:preprotein translocase subunit SecG [Aquimixticola soesokkakensis]SLN31604.1 Protein-export membrane protein SecG [Aquimixticola soesokkakensis]
MQNVILVIHLILALGLMGVVLLQRSEGGGLGMGGGDGGAVSSRGVASALSKMTWILAICFIGTSLTLTVLARREASTSSVVDGIAIEAPATDGTSPLGSDLLPPSAATPTAPAVDPLTPPRAE